MDGSDAKKQKHEARMIPGLGALEWGFPNSIITTVRYADIQVLNSVLGATSSLVYRANGIFDPEYTAVGHQPMYSDNYKAIYDYYTVIGSKITCTFHSRNSTLGLVVAVVGSDTTTLSSTVTTWLEQNNGVSAFTGSSASDPLTLTMTYSPEEQLGSNAKDDGSSMTPVGSDPTAGEGTFYWGILASSEDFGTTIACSLKINIEYTVKYSVLSKQTQN